MSNLKLIEVPSEIGAGTRGASLGIAAIKIAAHDFTSKFFKELPSEEVANENHLLYEPVKTPYARYIDGVTNIIERVADSVKNTLLEGKFPLVLAGDHSSSAGTISGIKMAYPNKRLGVIWVDAHADIHSPYTTPSGNMHGMPLAICLGEDNQDNRVNRPEKGTVDAWEKLKNLGGITPKVDYEDLVYIAVRDTEYPENVLIKNKKIKIYTVPELRKRRVVDRLEPAAALAPPAHGRLRGRRARAARPRLRALHSRRPLAERRRRAAAATARRRRR